MTEQQARVSDTDANLDVPAPVTQRRWLRFVLYLVIFVSGVIVGGGGILLVARGRILYAVHHPEDMPALVASRMRRVLSLSDQQTEEVEQIVRERQMAIQKLRREYQPELEKELDMLEQQVAEVLDQQQRMAWHKRLQELRDTWLPPVPGDASSSPSGEPGEQGTGGAKLEG